MVLGLLQAMARRLVTTHQGCCLQMLGVRVVVVVMLMVERGSVQRLSDRGCLGLAWAAWTVPALPPTYPQPLAVAERPACSALCPLLGLLMLAVGAMQVVQQARRVTDLAERRLHWS